MGCQKYLQVNYQPICMDIDESAARLSPLFCQHFLAMAVYPEVNKGKSVVLRHGPRPLHLVSKTITTYLAGPT